MKTVLQILPSLKQINGGVERGTLDVAKALTSSGFKSLIISSGGDMAEKYKYKGVDHHTIEIDKKGFFNFFLSKTKIKKILDKTKPDLIHVRSRWPAWCFSNEIKKRKIPLVTTYHGTYSGNENFLKRNYNKVMTRGDNIITISKFIDDHVRFFFPEVKQKLVQINRGIDTNYFDINSVSQIRKESFLNQIAVAENAHIVLLPARLTSWKGHMVALKALTQILKKRPELKVIMLFVGSENKGDSFTKKLEKKIKNLKLDGRVVFCGNISDMPSVYSVADIVLSTSIEPEAFGRVSAEACSMTKHVIASNHGGSREIIENGVTGWLVEPNKPDKLADQIIEVLDLEQNKKDLIGNNARKRIIEKFSLNQMLQKTIAVYEGLIAAKQDFNN
ncbi:MAG: glycosyltransferase family 4 protein [Alphaproteobacteria bacterium]